MHQLKHRLIFSKLASNLSSKQLRRWFNSRNFNWRGDSRIQCFIIDKGKSIFGNNGESNEERKGELAVQNHEPQDIVR